MQPTNLRAMAKVHIITRLTSIKVVLSVWAVFEHFTKRLRLEAYPCRGLRCSKNQYDVILLHITLKYINTPHITTWYWVISTSTTRGSPALPPTPVGDYTRYCVGYKFQFQENSMYNIWWKKSTHVFKAGQCRASVDRQT